MKGITVDMTGIVFFLLLTGVVFMVGSFFITERLSPSELNKITELSKDELGRIIDGALADAKSKVEESIEAQIFRTDLQGNIIAISDGETITWNNVPSNGEVLYAADFVSVKEEPNDTSSTVGELGPGNQIQVLNRNDNDLATIVFNGATSYITSSYLRDIDPQTMTQAAPSQPVGNMVWLSATGSKYHSRNNCGNMNPANARQVTESDAVSQGYEKCKKCW